MTFQKYLVLFFIINSMFISLYSESVYDLSLTKDAIISVSSLSLFTTSKLIEVSEGSRQNRDDINGLDSLFVNPYNHMIDSIGSYAAYATLIMPGLSLIYNNFTPKKSLTYGVMYAQGFLLTYGTKDILKALVSRDRPYTYKGDIPEGESLDYFNSFPSGHTSFAFLGATFLSQTFSTEYPDSKWRLPVNIGGYGLATFIGASRIYSGN